ncbi:unnamed protein product, partial [Amoebophrya sp. A120]
NAHETYTKQLAALQKIRGIAGGDLRLPQICVVGDQSSGKSSVLSLITGVTFPTAAGICTKAPIVVECCKKDPTGDGARVFEIKTANKDYVKCDIAELAEKILEKQQTALDALKQKVCTDEIFVRVSGPDVLDLIVIDLPGIIKRERGAQHDQ